MTSHPSRPLRAITFFPHGSTPTDSGGKWPSNRVRPGVTMSDRDWYDDGEYHDALERAERATRFGWAAIAGTAGALVCALIVLVALCVVAVVAGLYVVMAMR